MDKLALYGVYLIYFVLLSLGYAGAMDMITSAKFSLDIQDLLCLGASMVYLICVLLIVPAEEEIS